VQKQNRAAGAQHHRSIVATGFGGIIGKVIKAWP
jgi:hypothetical protein